MVRGLVSLLLVALVAGGVVALLVFGPESLRRSLPVAVAERLEGLAGPVAPDSAEDRSGDSPADFLADTPDGLIAEGPIAAMQGNQPVFIADVINGYPTRSARSIPAEITTIRPIMGCLLTPPLGGTVIGHAVAGQSNLPLGLATYNDRDLAGSVQDFVDAYRGAEDPGTVTPEVPPDLAFQSYDVVVTESASPVYLVLQTGAGNRIWNVHAAPGARIERVVLLGGGQVGVANLDPVVPVEVILGDGLAACGIRPAHALYGAALTGNAEAMAGLAEREAAVGAYDLWFRDTFGVEASATRAGFDGGSLSVVGPLPGPDAPLAVFIPVAGSKVRTTQDSFLEIAGQVAEGEDFAARVKAIATSFAFGDLANLRQGAEF